MTAVASRSPLTARRKLGAELRLLRDRLGLTTEEVGAELGCHNSKISRMENAKRACTKRDFEALMELYRVDEGQRAELEQLMIRGRQRLPPWWDAYSDVIATAYAEFLAYEAEAIRCREYQPLLIPAQLQTEEYARAVTSPGFTALGPDQVDSLVEVRLRRQGRPRDGIPMRLEVVVTEAALRLLVGGAEVMRDQLRHLRQATALDHVGLRVIPFTAGANGASTGAFTVFSPGEDPGTDVAFLESAEAATIFRDDPFTLRRLKRLLHNLSGAALSAEDTVKFLEQVEKDMA
jgi:transcriptional regulator with XRE-family HTH domain